METWENVRNHIYSNDRLFEFLSASIVDMGYGFASVEMEVLERHLNAAGVCHGGVIFTLADLAFALASNSYGELALAITSSIDYLKSAKLGDKLVASAKERRRTKRIAFYEIEVVNPLEAFTVALFKGIVFIFPEKKIVEL